MPDWRQIQARIRKAKTAQDPAGKLSELFLKTHDAMVALELAAWQEKAGNSSEAVRWYTTAAQRFRRADWKARAHEALTRLGAPIPPEETAPAPSASESGPAPERGIPPLPSSLFAAPAGKSFVTWQAEEVPHASSGLAAPEARDPQPASVSVQGEIMEGAAHAPGAAPVLPEARGNRKRRGRRGGRGRKRPGAVPAALAPPPPRMEVAAPVDRPVVLPSPRPEPPAANRRKRHGREPRPQVAAPAPARVQPAPPAAIERTFSRAGDPGLSSRTSQLEALLRRLIGAPLHALEDAAEAPAGPGIFLISDSDLITSYYVEDCQTLRVALGHLTRKERAPRGRGMSGGTLRAKLGEHLGINETKATQYLAKHCVIRWLQLDDDAEHLAHFAIAVLRTPLNIE
jgi:hypothetical protein